MMQLLKTIALLGLVVVSVPSFAAETARPGTVNYVEGSAYLDGRQLNRNNIGNTDMNPGDVIRTGDGKAEVLLTPGVYLRLDDNSTVKMINPDITPTIFELDGGRAAVEVDQIFKQNDLEVNDGGVTTHLAKVGYYEFDANPATALVYKGEAVVDEGDGKYQNLKQHQDIALVEGARSKPVKFDVVDAQNGLYKWSSLRSQYLAEANNQIAGQYVGAAGFYPGWYWDPYMWNYTYLGGGPFWSPFGFGFYPLGWGGFYGGFYGRPFYGGRVYGGFHGGYAGGFHRGGGFHGGGGGRR